MEAVQERERALRQALTARPFAPFALVMADGERLEVRRRFGCAFAGDQVYVRLPGRSVTTRLSKVAAIEFTPAPPPADASL